MTWSVLLLPEAEAELGRIPSREAAAITNAIMKLRAIGPQLGYPHTSDVRGCHTLRELRPRQGRSSWRVFYRQIGRHLVIAGVGPEADADPLGFKRAVKVAGLRLSTLEEEQ